MLQAAAQDYNSPIASLSELRNLFPAVPRGAGEAERSGNAIRAKSIRVSGHVMITPETYDNVIAANAITGRPPLLGVHPLYVEIFILRHKVKRTYGDLQPIDLQILDQGTSYSEFTGAIADLYTPHNSDRYQLIARKKIKLSAPFLSSLTTSGNAANTDESPSQLISMFGQDIKLDKVLRYNEADAAGTYPINECLVMCLGYVNPISGEIDTLDTKVRAQWSSRMTYTEY